MRQFESLKKNQEFRFVYQNGKSMANRLLVMYVIRNEADHNRIGISVSKKVGNSVVRHRITRLIRESCRLHIEDCKTGYDIVVVARANAKGKGYAEVESAFLHLTRLHDIRKKLG